MLPPIGAGHLVEKPLQAEVERGADRQPARRREGSRNTNPFQKHDRVCRSRSHGEIERLRQIAFNRVRQDVAKDGSRMVRHAECGIARYALGMPWGCDIGRGANKQGRKTRAPEQQEGQQTGPEKGATRVCWPLCHR